jgi:hypothetical protein
MKVFLLQSCFVPVNSLYDTAKPLGKGNTEVMGSYSYYTGSGTSLSSNYGFRAGIGISERTDLKIRYEHLGGLPVQFVDEDLFYSKGDYISFIPKFTLRNNHMAISTPVSLYLLKLGAEVGGSSESESVDPLFSIGPNFMYTWDLNPNKIDLTGGVRTEVFIGDGAAAFLGFSASAGFSSNLSKWAIRPEIGFLFGSSFGGGILNLGIGTQFYFNRKN